MEVVPLGVQLESSRDVNEGGSYHTNMENLMASSTKIILAWVTPLWDSPYIDDCADKVDKHADPKTCNFFLVRPNDRGFV